MLENTDYGGDIQDDTILQRYYKQNKIIKQGIRLTEQWFKRFRRQVEKDLKLCDTWEEFLERTQEYTVGTVMVSSGYSTSMQDIIVLALNDIRFQRASQRQLIEETIRNNVGNLIVNVNDELRQTVRDIVSKGYDDGLHPYEIGRNINHAIDSIERRRARTIARTEVKRTDTIANYIIAKERGAKSFRVKCRPDCCPLCAQAYADITGEAYEALTDENGKPTNGGHLIGGEKTFSMDKVEVLPPFHPNCRCTVYYDY